MQKPLRTISLLEKVNLSKKIRTSYRNLLSSSLSSQFLSLWSFGLRHMGLWPPCLKAVDLLLQLDQVLLVLGQRCHGASYGSFPK